jgi:hypothetical protein
MSREARAVISGKLLLFSIRMGLANSVTAAIYYLYVKKRKKKWNYYILRQFLLK